MKFFEKLLRKVTGTILPGVNRSSAQPSSFHTFNDTSISAERSRPTTPSAQLTKCPNCGGTGSDWTYEGGNRNAYLRRPMQIDCRICRGTGTVPQHVSLESMNDCQLGLHEYERVNNGLRADDVCVSCGHRRAVGRGRL